MIPLDVLYNSAVLVSSFLLFVVAGYCVRRSGLWGAIVDRVQARRERGGHV